MFCGICHSVTTAMNASFCSHIRFAARYFSDFKCQADDIGALAQKKIRRDAACQCLAWTWFMLCASLHLHTIFYTLPQTIFHTSSFTHNFVTRSLSHTHTPLSHRQSFTHNFVTHTHHLSLSHAIFHTQLCHTHTRHLSLSHTNFHMQLCHTQPPPPPSSFLPSPSLLQHFLLIIGRS